MSILPPIHVNGFRQGQFLCCFLAVLVALSLVTPALADDPRVESSLPEDELSFSLDRYCTELPDSSEGGLVQTDQTPMATIVLLVEDEEQLAAALGLGLEVPGPGEHELVVEQEALTPIQEAGLRFNVTDWSIRVRMSSAPGTKGSGTRSCGDQTDREIPTPDPFEDCPKSDVCTRSGCSISSAPWGATVTAVTYRVRVEFTRCSSIKMFISSGYYDKWEYIIWDQDGYENDGGYDDDGGPNDQDIYLYRTITSYFDGESPNQAWYLDACDCGYYFEEGKIDYAEFSVHYHVPEPMCAVNPTELDFAVSGIYQPIDKTFTITNSGDADLYGWLSWGGGWMWIDPQSYALPPGGSQQFGVQYFPTDCNPHTYVIDTGTYCEEAGDVTCNITIGPPMCDLWPGTTLNLSCPQLGGTTQDYFYISNHGCTNLNGELTWNCDEFTVEPTTYDLGSYGGAMFIVTYAPADCGNDVCTIDLGSGCGSMTCNAAGPTAPVCGVEPAHLEFQAEAGETVTETFTVANVNCGTLSGVITYDCDDFDVQPTTCDLGLGESQVFTVRFSPTALGEGTCTISLGPGCENVVCDWKCVKMWYVGTEGHNQTGDGSDGKPWHSIQCGINRTQPGQIVKLLPGTYYEHGIRMKSGVHVVGGAAKNGAIVDGESRGSVFECRGVQDAALQNLTITGGSRSGVDCSNSTLLVKDCQFVNNSTSVYGGGAITSRFSEPTVENCTFTENHTRYFGGAIYGYRSTVDVSDCSFDQNTAGKDGGGLYVKESTVEVSGCEFSQNLADNGGGIYGERSTLGLEGTVLWANKAAGGGGLYLYKTAPDIMGCTFAANAADYGAAMSIYSKTRSTVKHTIVAFHENGPWYRFLGSNSVPTFTCCDICGNFGGDWVGPVADQRYGFGNMPPFDPLFCDLTHGDCHLTPGSPCEMAYACGLVGALGVGCTKVDPVTSSVPNEMEIQYASGLYLGPAVPNPFNPSTEISYAIPDDSGPSRVTLIVYNPLGQRVRTLVDRVEGPGLRAAVWNGTDQNDARVASGVYFYRITWNGESETRRMVLLK